MNQTETAAVAGALAGATLFLLFIVLAWIVLLIIAYWKIFTKAGEKGWKSLIPIYNTYVQYRISWNTNAFWIFLALFIASSVFSGLASNDTTSSLFLVLSTVAGIAVLVWSILSCNKLAKAFGKGTGFTIGLILLNPIFMLILGFGGAQYIGPQE